MYLTKTICEFGFSMAPNGRSVGYAFGSQVLRKEALRQNCHAKSWLGRAMGSTRVRREGRTWKRGKAELQASHNVASVKSWVWGEGSEAAMTLQRWSEGSEPLSPNDIQSLDTGRKLGLNDSFQSKAIPRMPPNLCISQTSIILDYWTSLPSFTLESFDFFCVHIIFLIQSCYGSRLDVTPQQAWGTETQTKTWFGSFSWEDSYCHGVHLGYYSLYIQLL